MNQSRVFYDRVIGTDRLTGYTEVGFDGQVPIYLVGLLPPDGRFTHKMFPVHRADTVETRGVSRFKPSTTDKVY